jgi:putative aldouronate transport system permease protein
MNTTMTAFGKKKNKRMSYGKKMMKMHWQLYLIILLPLLYVIVFSYVPMYGVQLGFKQYYVSKGINGSPWVGLKFFKQFFSSTSSWLVIKNTITISLYSLIAGFPLPIILAVALNEARNKFFKKTVQMVTYAPYFISTVVMVGMLFQVLDPQIGIVAKMLGDKAGQLNLLGDAKYFKSLYVWSGIWQGTGYSSIIYLAALAGVDPSLQEAAIIDGASKIKRIWHVDLPSIAPTIVILLILSVGGIMSVGFEKVYLMQNSMNASSSEIISTYVYKVGLVSANFSFSTAIGLFNSVVNLILLASVNFIAKRLGETSLW